MLRSAAPVFLVDDVSATMRWYGDTEFVIRDRNGCVLVFSELLR